MFDKFAKIPSYFEWLVIASAFLALVLSSLSLWLMIFARRRVSRAEDFVKEIASAVNKIATDAERAAENASVAASASAESAKAARESASAATSSARNAETAVETINRGGERLIESELGQKQLGEARETLPTKK